ncbi:MAG: fumarylacetoacetate hydrolase family protein, partial [Pirellulaceae bacterium]
IVTNLINMKIAKLNLDGRTTWAKVVSENQAVKLPDDFSLADWKGFEPFTGSTFEINRNKLVAPALPTSKIICIGKNYADHAAEMGGAVPELPIIFSKYPTALNGPYSEIVLPKISHQVDYEAELVVVVGKRAKDIPQENAMAHVLGYTCGNDVSARDWQKGRPGGQWLVGKSFDTFAPIGPWITTADEVPDPGQLNVTSRLNGKVMQDASTRLLIYPIEHLVSYLSQFFTLDVGDLIFTGTPAGVGAGRTPPVFLKSGDQIEVTVSGLGTISNRCV